MIRVLFLVVLHIYVQFPLFSQVFDDFSDGDFTNDPTWSGDVSDFIINENFELQLDAFSSGDSKLFTRFTRFDSLEWGIDIKMDFSPSNSNKIRIYLMIDTFMVDIANGYFIEIGENGASDNIKFYRLINGESILMAEGEDGKYASGPITISLKIVLKNNGLWQIFTKNDKEYFVEEFEVYDELEIVENPIFLIYMKYSKTRVDKYFFDNIYIKSFETDKSAPKILKAKLIEKNLLELIFNEPLEENSILNNKNYTLSNNFEIEKIYFDYNIPNKLILSCNKNFESGIINTISIKGIRDIKGNEVINPILETFYLIEKPKINDLIINEILFNPNTGGSDFVELFNSSNKYLNIEGVEISNSAKDNKLYIIKDNLVLKMNQYICLTSNPDDIRNDYFIPDSANLIKSKLPSFDDLFGNVTLSYFDSLSMDWLVLDSFDYNEEMHSSFVYDPEGVSLERKNAESSTNDKFNWTSCSTQIGGATPGYKNSSFYALDKDIGDEISFKNKVFSPNFDGIDDELIIHYNFKQNIKLANMYILDSKGRVVLQLLNNETLGNKGVINWNGFIDDMKAAIGIYVLYYNIIDEEGISFNGKKAFVLADYLK